MSEDMDESHGTDDAVINSEDIENTMNLTFANERYNDNYEGEHFLLPSPNARTPEIPVKYIRRSSVGRYNPALKNLIPVRLGKPEKGSMPADSAGLFSYIFYTWVTPYIWKANKKGITIDDIPYISSYETCKYNAQRLEILWQEELSNRGPRLASFHNVAWRFVRTRIYIAWILLTCTTLCGFISPMILMKKLLEHIEPPEENYWEGIKWALLLTCCDLLRMIFFTWTWNTNIRTGLRLKSACSTLLYKKIIRLNSLGNKSTGELINLFTNDSQRLFDAVIYGPMILNGPIIVTCGVFYILWIFGPLALLGTLVFLLFYPFQYLISRGVGYFRSKTVVITDRRVKLMNEILDCIKLIKMCSWEKYFSRKLLDIRKKEKSWLHKTVYFQSLAISLTPAVPVISAIITIIAHLSSGNSLTAAQVFPFISLLNSQFRSSFMFIQVALVSIAESKITLNRLQNVLLLEESTCHASKPIVKSQAVVIANGTFVHENSTLHANDSGYINNGGKKDSMKKVELEKLNESSKETQYIEVLSDIKFGAAKDGLIGICGHVGSGKSSLLLAALGQLKMTEGHIFREGSCAYVSQQAWIVNATLRENILFGNQFDAQRYYHAVTVCNLKEDINMLPGGDDTEIGERGINLSGGQKQRVALARALYANRDIYFLDDPLSAVDVHVGSYIFKNLILGALKKKCVLFVTHQVQFLKHCDQIFLLSNGRIIEQGSHDELMQLNKEYTAMVHSSLLKTEDNTKEQTASGAQLESKNSGNDLKMQTVRSNSGDDCVNGETSSRMHGGGATLITQEKVETGTVKLHTYHMYIKSAGGYFVALLVFCTLFLNVGSSAFSTWWLATWIKAGGGNITDPQTNETIVSENLNDNPDLAYYKNVYGACIGAILITSLIRGLIITYTTISASTTLHNKVFKKMIESTLTFFETTPSGRIQNIFSRDIDEVDNYIPISVENMVQNFFTCSFPIIFICVIIPWFSLPLIILGSMFFCISRIFRVAMRDFKRMESTTRSPVLSFVTTTVHGLNTIHAFQKEKAFTDKFEELFDLNNLGLFLCQSIMRWSAARLDSLAILSSSITAFLVIAFKNQLSPAFAGLAMAYSTQMTGVFQYTVRLMAETETRFISVERISHYIRTLQKEGISNKSPVDPSNEWPTHGKLEFHEVQLSYRKELAPILNNISFVTNAGEHVGIVGRTGAGKSSLIVALFRLVEISSGKIKIDGIDIAKVNLDILRSKLAIIPQDPVLFSGTIRSNLDPFKQCDDSDIWSALEKTKMKEKVKNLPGLLDAFIEVGGNNLSVGERQLLCLTRALLRNTKLMILDEATAAVDPETEEAVQSTIQNEFSHCTVLTIAHRLKTVVSCDRVIVMKNGQIIEFDAPSTLLSNQDSEFSKMLASADKAIKES
ncbi:ATP-binding cassette sub-family C member 5-like isoform X3 [Lasioglossum baleicum]|uniref:ATP-binding cassette sub-family C member 5-like isoform X3 n=1 Tax=Lasioglossum baleicum TaxID=434251 RepID=UPI003FCDFD89